MTVVLSTKPSDSTDPRFRLPRSPHCPNDAPASVVAAGLAGTCGQCAWGFYTLESSAHMPGENTEHLDLIPIMGDEMQMGYKARCGKVALYRDDQGRVGPTRVINGEKRFFPGLEGNWAYERYLTRHPQIAGRGSICAAA